MILALALAAAVTITPQIRRMNLLGHMVPGQCVTTAQLRASNGLSAAVSETTVRADAQWLADQQYPVTKGGTASRILWCR